MTSWEHKSRRSTGFNKLRKRHLSWGAQFAKVTKAQKITGMYLVKIYKECFRLECKCPGLQKAIKSEVGDVSILINNAGVLYCRPFLQHSARQIENVISTNLMGKWFSNNFQFSAACNCMLFTQVSWPSNAQRSLSQQHLAFMFGPLGIQAPL